MILLCANAAEVTKVKMPEPKTPSILDDIDWRVALVKCPKCRSTYELALPTDGQGGFWTFDVACPCCNRRIGMPKFIQWLTDSETGEPVQV